MFIFVAWQMMDAKRGPTAFDDAIRFKFYNMRNDSLTTVVKAVTYFGNWQTTIIIAGILILYKKTQMKLGVPAAIMATISVTTYTILKPLFNRPRPDRALWLSIRKNMNAW